MRDCAARLAFSCVEVLTVRHCRPMWGENLPSCAHRILMISRGATRRRGTACDKAALRPLFHKMRRVTRPKRAGDGRRRRRKRPSFGRRCAAWRQRLYGTRHARRATLASTRPCLLGADRRQVGGRPRERAAGWLGSLSLIAPPPRALLAVCFRFRSAWSPAPPPARFRWGFRLVAELVHVFASARPAGCVLFI